MAETPKQALLAMETHVLLYLNDAKYGSPPVYIEGEVTGHLDEAACAVPSSRAEYDAARLELYSVAPSEFNLWKAKNLRTPEKMIQDYWPNIRGSAAKFGVPVEVLGGILLNEMRALQNDDINNDLVAGADDLVGRAYRFANRFGLADDKMPSIGVAQLRPDTILKRRLLEKVTWPNGYVSEKHDGAPPLALRDFSKLSAANFVWFEDQLTDPVFSIEIQAAHIRVMTDLIRGQTWGVPPQPNVGIPGAAIVDGTLTGAQADALAAYLPQHKFCSTRADARVKFQAGRVDRKKLFPRWREAFGQLAMLNAWKLDDSRMDLLTDAMIQQNGFAVRPADKVPGLISDGSAFCCLLGMYIDQNEGQWQDPQGRPLPVFDAPWGFGIADAARDVKRYLLGAAPDWPGFLKDRKVYDERGFFGPFGQILPIPNGERIPQRWWQAIIA